MREYVPFSEAAGRTIEAVAYAGGDSVIAFSDGTWSSVGIVCWHDDDYIEVGDRCSLDFAYGSLVDALVRLSIATKEEIQQYVDERNAERNAGFAARRAAQDSYWSEVLRTPFEGA